MRDVGPGYKLQVLEAVDLIKDLISLSDGTENELLGGGLAKDIAA